MRHLAWQRLLLSVVMLSVIMLSFKISPLFYCQHNNTQHNMAMLIAVCCYAECHYADFQNQAHYFVVKMLSFVAPSCVPAKVKNFFLEIVGK
jgi:hypothetical protein